MAIFQTKANPFALLLARAIVDKVAHYARHQNLLRHHWIVLAAN